MFKLVCAARRAVRFGTEPFRASLKPILLDGVKGLLRLERFDTSTEEGRGKERYRRAALTTSTSIAARGVSILTGLIAVRLAVRYLGTERYGLWMTITSVVSMMSFADLGVGNGLLNSISEAHGRDQVASVRKYVSSAFFVLFGIAILLVGLFAVAYPFVPWPRLFNVSSALAAHEAGPAVVVFLACFLINLPLGVVQRVQTGYQEGFASDLWSAAGGLLGFGGLLVAIYFQAGLPWLLMAISGGQLLGIIGNWGYEFCWTRPWLFPVWSAWDTGAARRILRTGVMFLILQACYVFSFMADNLIITQILGPEAVTQFAVPMRMFLFTLSVAGMFLSPLWPAYGEAIARGDVKWVRATVVRSTGLCLLVFGPIALSLALFGKVIAHIWVGPQIQPSSFLLLGMGIWTVLVIYGNSMAMFFNGAYILKFQVGVAVSVAAGSLALKILCARSIGLPGIIWAGALTCLLADVAVTIYLSRLLNKPAAFWQARLESGRGFSTSARW
jgi:O-antigen/teichoic acid export membrane protein